MILRYSDIEWNDKPVVWYITCCSIVLASPGEELEKPEVHEADDEVQGMCDDFKDQVVEMIKRPIEKLDADSFAIQIAHSGIHFYIKASISNKEYVHLRIHRPFSYRGEEGKLESVLTNQGKRKPLNYF